jgi:hypothetical protein
MVFGWYWAAPGYGPVLQASGYGNVEAEIILEIGLNAPCRLYIYTR